MRTLHSPRCDMQRVLAILASLLVSHVQCGKFSVISVLPNITNSRMFCMIYFEKFKELPETPEESEYVKMVNFTAQNGCKKLQSINLKGKLALIRDSADCSLDQVVLNFKAAQAYGIVIASSRYKIENLIAEKNDSSRKDIVVGFVTDGTAEHILHSNYELALSSFFARAQAELLAAPPPFPKFERARARAFVLRDYKNASPWNAWGEGEGLSRWSQRLDLAPSLLSCHPCHVTHSSARATR
ncbi:hypothetical protein ISCGN_005354 [Ixodes scapularis]